MGIYIESQNNYIRDASNRVDNTGVTMMNFRGYQELLIVAQEMEIFTNGSQQEKVCIFAMHVLVVIPVMSDVNI